MTDLDTEQIHVSDLYLRLDGLRADSADRLARSLRETGGSFQARTERDVSVRMYTEQLAQYSAVENGLCFGKLDFADGTHNYIGRIGIFDEDDDYEPLLMDWRAPAARSFYLATAASPDGVRVRRHIRTSGRTVVALDDEVLDLAAAHEINSDGLTGEAALMAAVNATRTGRMSDIVQTIQAEQDHIIRSGLGGVLVVQGGPGTGKTAVALHRAAFLLYTYREQLARRGVLIVGPNSTFLRYISQVLPALGETGVLLGTVGELFPGVRAEGTEPDEVAALKGGPRMVDVLRAAVRDRQRLPETALEIVVDRETLTLDRETCLAARTRARRSRRTHNEARPLFAEEIVRALIDQVAGKLGAEFLDPGDLDDIRTELTGDAEVQAAIEWLWPVLTAQQLLTDLYADRDRLAVTGLNRAGQDLLWREPGPWTPADVPLLDEAVELLGEDDREARARADRDRQAQVDYAEGVLDILNMEDDADPDILTAYDLIDAGRLADRHDDSVSLTAAQRAAADRTWTFGHVIVDEAQELSAMAWRLLMRRCPSRSMTLVGDVAQTGDLAGANSWQQVLQPYVADRWRLAELTVNYRTPAEIAAVAADVLAVVDEGLEPPRPVRETGVPPWHLAVEPGALAGRVAELVAEPAEGTLAVIAPPSLVGELAEAIGMPAGERQELDGKVAVLTVRQAKGLEFDSVLIVEPDRIMAESQRGPNDLYVALTRATQRLGVVHTGELPAVFAHRDRFTALARPSAC